MKSSARPSSTPRPWQPHDAFPFHLVESIWPAAGHARPQPGRFPALGLHDSGAGAQFNMTLALRSAAVNAVISSRAVTRAMWISGPACRTATALRYHQEICPWIAGDLADSLPLGPD
jgi:hypothetical protein